MALQPGDLLTVAQALKLLPVSRSAFYRLVEAGQLPALRMPSVGLRAGRILIRRRDLEHFVRDLPRVTDEAPPPPSESVDEILQRIESGAGSKQGKGDAR